VGRTLWNETASRLLRSEESRGGPS